VTASRRILDKLWDVLLDRKGFDDWWDFSDADTQVEITETLVAVLDEELHNVSMTRILVVNEKHGDRYFDASTDAALHAAALKLVEERLEQGWYGDWRQLDDTLENLNQKKMLLDLVSDQDGVAAWAFLKQRNGQYEYEYENVSIVELEKP